MKYVLTVLSLVILTGIAVTNSHADAYVANALNLPAGDSGAVYGINDSGQIVGGTCGNTGEYAAIWNSPTSNPEAICGSAVQGGTYATFITDSGVVVGKRFENGVSYTFSWTASGGISGTWANYSATAVNNNGQAVGDGPQGVGIFDSAGDFSALDNPFGSTDV